MAPSAPYVLHGHDVSYFSGKVRPAFPYKSLWYREVLPDIAEIRRRTGLNYFPVVFTPDGEVWQDTSDILDALERRHPEPPLHPRTPVQRIVAYLIELYGDEMGILPAMHYRWTFDESVQKVAVDFSAPAGKPGSGEKFASKMSRTLPGIGVTERTIPAIEAHTRDLLDALSRHFAAHRYLLGDSMSLADCGLMGPFYGHLYRDAVPRKLLYESAFHVCAWIERMNRPPLETTGWLPDDALAETLVPVLRVMADGVPYVVAAVKAIEAWAAENGTAGDPPQIAGAFQATYRDVAIEAFARTYTLWMVQRTLDAWTALSAPEKDAVRAALDGTGWEALLALRPRHRLVKRGYQLAWQSD